VPCRITTTTTFKEALKETVGGWHVIVATFKVGMRVHRSGGGARPKADRVAAPR
jgi:hypothetical protein